MLAKTIYWTITHINHKPFLFAATEKGLSYLDSHSEPFLPFKKWAQKNLPTFTLIENEKKLNPYIDELRRYFSRESDSFTLPFDLYGTAFQLSVWEALLDVEYGETVSYTHIAHALNKPTAVRAVANAIGANPLLIFIPCHRVIGKDGSLTGFRSGLDLKKTLLSLESK